VRDGPSFPALERDMKSPENRRAIRAALLKRLRLDPGDDRAIASKIEDCIKQAIALRTQVAKNRLDRQKEYQLLARIGAAAILASDDEGRYLRKLREMCLQRGISTAKKMPILRLALKAFGSYEYGDPTQRRPADKKVSRDYTAIQRLMLRGIIPTEFVEFWSKPGQGLDACSRPLKKRPDNAKTGGKPDTRIGQLPISSNPKHLAIMTALPAGAFASARIRRMPDRSFKIEMLEYRPPRSPR
jgi:hypothetical protein